MISKGIDIEDFKRRQEMEARARNIFYADVDAGHLPADSQWTLAPYEVRQQYRRLADVLTPVRAEATPTAQLHVRVVMTGLRPITNGKLIGSIGVRP